MRLLLRWLLLAWTALHVPPGFNLSVVAASRRSTAPEGDVIGGLGGDLAAIVQNGVLPTSSVGDVPSVAAVAGGAISGGEGYYYCYCFYYCYYYNYYNFK